MLFVGIIALVAAHITGWLAHIIDFVLTVAILYFLLLGWFVQDVAAWLS